MTKKLKQKVKHEEEKELNLRRFENALIRQKRKEDFLKIFCLVAVLGGVAGNVILSMTVLQEIKKPQTVAILDESKNITVTPLENIDHSIELEKYCSELCTTALLSRNWQVAYTYPDMMPRVFSDATVRKINEEGDVWKKDAKAARLHWSPMITKFTPHSNEDGSIIITKVQGLLKETGTFGGVLEERTSEFVLGLKLKQNPKIGERGRFPWVCVSYNLTIK